MYNLRLRKWLTCAQAQPSTFTVFKKQCFRLRSAGVSLTLWNLVQDADSTDIYQISRNWADLVKRARAKKLAPDEFNSGTFTISNMGMYGADTFDAILPPGKQDVTQ